MSGMIGANSEFSGVNFREGQLSKAYVKGSKFVGCDFTNAVLDRVVFDEADLSQAIFSNAVLSGTTFTGSNLKDTDFTDAYLGNYSKVVFIKNEFTLMNTLISQVPLISGISVPIQPCKGPIR